MIDRDRERHFRIFAWPWCFSHDISNPREVLNFGAMLGRRGETKYNWNLIGGVMAR